MIPPILGGWVVVFILGCFMNPLTGGEVIFLFVALILLFNLFGLQNQMVEESVKKILCRKCQKGYGHISRWDLYRGPEYETEVSCTFCRASTGKCSNDARAISKWKRGEYRE